jgi:hypothetical protein
MAQATPRNAAPDRNAAIANRAPTPSSMRDADAPAWAGRRFRRRVLASRKGVTWREVGSGAGRADGSVRI